MFLRIRARMLPGAPSGVRGNNFDFEFHTVVLLYTKLHYTISLYFASKYWQPQNTNKFQCTFPRFESCTDELVCEYL